MGSRARQVSQKDLNDSEKCEGGICKSNDIRWTEMCSKHKKEADAIHQRWQREHTAGVDLTKPLSGDDLERYRSETQ